MNETPQFISFEEHFKLKTEFEQKQKDIEQRLWLDATVSEFDNLLRLNYDKSTEDFTKVVLQHLAETTHTFMGVFYVFDKAKQELNATATYACKLEKLTQTSYLLGEGSIGQSAESKKVIYFDDLPKNSLDFTVFSVKINVASMMVIPLIFNDEVFGVLELMFLKSLEEKYHNLLNIVSRNIASMLESIFNNAFTKKLLLDAQQQNEALQAQEEELRQNMEELQSTQEELHRKQAQVQAQFEAINRSNILRSEFTPEGYLKDANSIFYETFGYKEQELKGKHHATLLSKKMQDSPEYITFWEKLRAGKQQAGKFERIDKNGNLVVLDATYSPLLDKEGRVESILKYAINITEIKNLLDNSQKQEKKLEETISEMTTLKRDLEARMQVFNMSVIMSESDLFGNILYVNDKLLDITKYEETELIGKPHNILRHADMPKSLFKLLWKTIKAGKIFKGVIKNRKKDGTHYWTNAFISPVLDENEKPTKYIGIRYLIENDAIAEQLFKNMCEEYGL